MVGAAAVLMASSALAAGPANVSSNTSFGEVVNHLGSSLAVFGLTQDEQHIRQWRKSVRPMCVTCRRP